MKRIALLCVAAALVGGGAFAAYRHSRALTPAEEASALVSELPSDAPFIYYLDAAAFRNSSFFNSVMKKSPSVSPSNDYNNFVQETGFDFSKDLDRLALAVQPQPDGTSKLTVIGDGRFDQSKIAAYSSHHEGSSTNGKGGPAFSFRDPSDGHTTVVTLLSPNHIRIESIGMKSAATASTAGATPATYVPAAKELSRVAGAPMFAIAEMSAWQGQAQAQLGQYGQMLKNMRWLTITAAPQADSLNITLEAECATAQDSMQLQSMLTTMKTFVPAIVSQPSMQQKLGANGVAAANDLVNSIQITNDESRVRLAFSISTQLLNQFQQPPAKASSSSSGN